MRNKLYVAASAVSTTALLLAAFPAGAANAPKDEDLTEVVVTGTRVAERTRLDTLSPVDVLSATTLTQQGSTELATTLSRVAPSLDFPRPAVTDGTDSVRPATLRGLAPDQTLVLVNSKRRHATALVNLNGSVGRGAASVDLNALPLAAIERVEVLRDGASAQYGSDAIAGVVNIKLREARSGGEATASYGRYDTQVNTANGSRHETDGRAYTLSAWAGLPLGNTGFVTLTGELRDQQPTSRGDFDPRVTPTRVTSRFGDPESRNTTFYVNAGAPLGGEWNFYGWAGHQDRKSSSAATPRLANNAANVPAIYPNGFLPLIAPKVVDDSLGLGVRGQLAGWQTDASLVYGRNDLRYYVDNSLNPTYGATSPTSFYAGRLTYNQLVADLSFVRGVDVGLASPLNVAWGLEARSEGYVIGAGEHTSYDRGTVAPTQTPGAQGFPGLQPSNVVDKSRSAASAYVDLESRVTEQFLASVAGRFEHYSDFGSTTNGKLSLRYDFDPAFALRGTVSTGFRAPSLQQQYFTSTATVFTNGVPFETGTFPATSATAVALGGKALEPEKSTNYSIGAVFRVSGFEATVDAYRIELRNRIVLSENLSGGAITTLLAPFNVTAARFFINGVASNTRGVDVVLRYVINNDRLGRFDLSASGNANTTTIVKVPTGTSTIPNVTLFARQNQLRFEQGTPADKQVLSLDWSHGTGFGSIGANVRTTRYGQTLSAGTTSAADVVLDPKILTDIELRAKFAKGVTVSIGADNIGDVYPTKVPAALNTTGVGAFSSFSPFGFNGRYYYARASFGW